ncbi:MAG TPA: AMP-binding protein [Candidatus Xenobia bacterium]|nr:AMP-binding protein [Candidatus Xenobia bacterium]
MRHRSLVDLLAHFEEHARAVACAHPQGYRMARWSYGELLDTASRFACELEARGVAAGDRVLLWGENRAEWVAAFWGCVLRGAVVVPMDRIAAPEFVQRVVAQIQPKLCVVSAELARLGLAQPTLVLENLRDTVSRHSTKSRELPMLDRSTTAQIIFTSGTTATPRGVVLTHGNLLSNLEPIETEMQKFLKYVRLVRPVRFLNLVPLSHVLGQFMGLLIPPLLGATVIFSDSLNPAEIARTLKRERAMVLIAVPRLLETLKEKVLRDLEADGRRAQFERDFVAAEGQHFLRRWWRFRCIHRSFGWKFRAFVCGGAALGRETETFWKRLGYAVVQGYGLTETASLVSVNHPLYLRKGSIGRVVPGRELKLADDGEILVRGESVAAGYWQEAKLTPVAGDDGWFHTGDLGEFDAKGNLYFKGRKKNVIVTAEGLNVFPEDLEAALRRQPEVRDAAVVGLPRNGNAEPCAVLLLREPGADAEAIVQRANRDLADFQRLRRWVVWPEGDFPRTPTQKPQLHVLEQFARSASATAAPPSAASPLAELLARVTGRAVELRPEATLESDLNLSSIERVELLSALEDRFQIELSEAALTGATTVRELEEMLRRPAPRAEYAYRRWPQRWPAVLARALLHYLFILPPLALMAWPRIRGRENLRGVRGPLLIVCNHVTRADVAFVLAALPARIRRRVAVAMEGERLEGFRRPPGSLGFFARLVAKMKYFLLLLIFNVFPLPRRSGFRESFTFAGESVDRGFSLLVFPEGELTKDGRLARFQSGIGLLATKLNLPVLPVRVDGLWELKQAGKRFARPGAVRVTLGAPLRFAPDADPAAIAADLERAVTSL